jgi:putative transposase
MIIGFGTHAGIVDGMSLCWMFHRAIGGQVHPKYLSSDNDPLYRFHQWQANLRILQLEEIKTTPYVPLSCLDLKLFWTCQDLESKLRDFQDYYNRHRTHSARAGCTPQEKFGPLVPDWRLGSDSWRRQSGGLYQTPLVA